MANTLKSIQMKRKLAAGAPAAGNLLVGELVINMATNTIYTKNPSNQVVELGIQAGGGTISGNLQVNGRLGVTGAVEFGDTLKVAGMTMAKKSGVDSYLGFPNAATMIRSNAIGQLVLGGTSGSDTGKRAIFVRPKGENESSGESIFSGDDGGLTTPRLTTTNLIGTNLTATTATFSGVTTYAAGSRLEVNGAFVVANNATINGALTTANNSEFKAGLKVGGYLTVDGATTLNKSVAINDTLWAKTSIAVDGPLTSQVSTYIDARAGQNSHLVFRSLENGNTQAMIHWDRTADWLNIRSADNNFAIQCRRTEVNLPSKVTFDRRGGSADMDVEVVNMNLGNERTCVMQWNVNNVRYGGSYSNWLMYVQRTNADRIALGVNGRFQASGQDYGDGAGHCHWNGDLAIANGRLWANDVYIRSDIKLKDDIHKIESALDKIDVLNGVEYTMKSTGIKEYGLIAQDVEKVLPHAVINQDDIKRVSYRQIIGILVEAIKELKTEVEKLRGN